MPKILTNVREDILRITRETMSKSGSTQFSIREIAEKCGIGTGTMYNYFHSKQEIIASILASDWDLMLRRIGSSNKSSCDYMKKLEVIFNELGLFMNTIHNMLSETFYDEFDISKIKARKIMIRNQVADVIAQAIEKDFPQADITAVSKILTGLFLSLSDSDTGMNFDDFKLYITKLLN